MGKTIQRVGRNAPILTQDYEEADLRIWSEVLFAAELLMLHVAPVYYGGRYTSERRIRSAKRASWLFG